MAHPATQTSGRAMVRQLSDNVKTLEPNPEMRIDRYLTTAQRVLEKAGEFREEGNDEQLYVMLLRFASLMIETIPKHPSFSASDPTFVALKMVLVTRHLPELERLKCRLSGEQEPVQHQDVGSFQEASPTTQQVSEPEDTHHPPVHESDTTQTQTVQETYGNAEEPDQAHQPPEAPPENEDSMEDHVDLGTEKCEKNENDVTDVVDVTDGQNEVGFERSDSAKRQRVVSPECSNEEVSDAVAQPGPATDTCKTREYVDVVDAKETEQGDLQEWELVQNGEVPKEGDKRTSEPKENEGEGE